MKGSIYLVNQENSMPMSQDCVGLARWRNVFPDTNMSEKRKQLILIKRLVSDNIFVSKVGSDTNSADALIQYL